MESNTIYEIIQQALDIQGKEVKLANSSLKVVASHSFKPISDFFSEKQELCYSESLINELEASYHEQLRYPEKVQRSTFPLRKKC